MTLCDDDPGALRSVLEFCYKGHYTFWCSEVDDDKELQKAKWDVNAYVVASKYLIPSLCSDIIDRFGEMLEAAVTECPSVADQLARLEELAQQIYRTHSDAAHELREQIVEQLKRRADMKDLKQLLLEIPELGFDLIVAFAEEHKKMSSLSSSKGAAIKRASHPKRTSSRTGYCT